MNREFITFLFNDWSDFENIVYKYLLLTKLTVHYLLNVQYHVL